MTIEEAKKFIQDIANGMGSMAMEYWSENTGDKLREALDVLEQEPDWIPVSERLPEEGRYLTTILNGELRYKMICDYYRNGCWCPDDQCASDNVIAWMPLPESYKAESEE